MDTAVNPTVVVVGGTVVVGTCAAIVDEIHGMNCQTSPYLDGLPAVATSTHTLTFATPVKTMLPSTGQTNGAPRSLHGP